MSAATASADWTPEAASAFLIGSLSASAARWDDLPARANRALGWYRRLASVGLEGVPLCLVADLGWLLLLQDAFPFRSLHERVPDEASERELRMLYEGRLLNGLLADVGFRRASFSIGRLEDPDDAVARAIELLLRPLLGEDGGTVPALREPCGRLGPPRFNPALLRETAVRGHDEPEAARAELDRLSGAPGWIRAQLRRCLRLLLSAMARGPLLLDEDLHELEHWAVFARPSQRLLSRRVAELVRRLGRFDARGFTERVEPEQVQTELPDEGYYPEGGIAELTCKGALESLVPSELIYMDEWTDRARDLDLFMVRWLEGELLYYLRDTGQLRRRRRTIAIAVDASAASRLRPPGAPDNLAVMGYGLALRLAADIRAVFSQSSVQVHVIILAAEENEQERAGEDRELVELMMADDVARQLATVRAAPRLSLGELVERGRHLEAVVIGPPHAPAFDRREQPVEPLAVVLGGREEEADPDAGRWCVPFGEGRDAAAGMRAARDAVVRRLAGAGVSPARRRPPSRSRSR